MLYQVAECGAGNHGINTVRSKLCLTLFLLAITFYTDILSFSNNNNVIIA